MKILLIASVIFLSAPAFAADCFMNSAVTSFESNGRDSVIVTAFKKKYQVDTFVCFDLEWANAIAFKSWSGSSRICKGDDLLIVDTFGNGYSRKCRISKVTKL